MVYINMHGAEARAPFPAGSIGRAAEACSPDPIFDSQNEDSILTRHFVNKGQDAIFATITRFDLKNRLQQQQLNLAGHAGAQAGARFIQKISTASRQERWYVVEGC